MTSGLHQETSLKPDSSVLHGLARSSSSFSFTNFPFFLLSCFASFFPFYTYF